MERDASSHPAPNSDRVNVQGRDLSEDELSALTPEQRMAFHWHGPNVARQS